WVAVRPCSSKTGIPSPVSYAESRTPARSITCSFICRHFSRRSSAYEAVSRPLSTIKSMAPIDVSEQDFETSVIERSRTVPVVVDFWAEWCGPCRQLGPVLEKAVAARAGKGELAKIDVDSTPAVARTFGIQSIPAVKAFRDGRVAAEFVGAQPPAAVDKFLDSLLPSEADQLVAAGDEDSLRR